ncbi:MAG: transcriptional regulator NrdR [Bdellovibrionia bacterium]
MKCPFCGHADDRVLDTRVQRDGSIRRRRECLECKARFSTVETIQVAFPYIIKKDGRREPFSKEKILKGLQASCSKRPVSLAQMEQVVERIAAWVINRGESEISSRLIGKKVMAELKQLDDVAYIRFASVYRTFKDVQEFVETLEDAELLDLADSNSPQLSLAPIVELSNLDFEEKAEKNEKTSSRTRIPSPISN